MENVFDKLANLFSGDKKKEENQGAGKAPSLLSQGVQAAADAWTGFLNKMQETTKQNIQSGNYSVAEEPKKLESHFSSHDNVQQKATAKIPQKESQAKTSPWKLDNPFEEDDQNEMFHKTAEALYDANPDQRERSPFKAAYEITNQYINDVNTSYDLTNGQRNPFRIAGRIYQDTMEKAKSEFTALGKSADELKALLDESGLISEKQRAENQKQGIINAATGMQKTDGKAAEREKAYREKTEKEAAGYDRLGRIVSDVTNLGIDAVAPEDAALYWDFYNSPKGGALIRNYMSGTASLDDINNFGSKRAEALRSSQPKSLTYEEADEYLNANLPMYGLAKETNGKTDEYYDAYGKLLNIGSRVRSEGFGSLTPAEQRAWTDALENGGMDYLGDWATKGGINGDAVKLTGEQAQKLMDFGSTRQQQVKDVAGWFPEYQMTDYQKGLWDAYVKTPEGAAQWLEDAAGTKDEQKARDNLWMVERRTKYEGKAASPDFALQSTADEDFHSSDREFEQIYRIINNIDNAAYEVDVAADQRSLAGYAAFWAFLEPEEKAVFNAYANEGAIDEAKKYLEYMTYAINERMAQKGAENMQAMGESGWGGGLVASAVSVPLSISRGIGYIDQLWQNARNLIPQWYKPVDKNTGAMQVGRMADAARQGVQNQADWNVNILGQNVDVFDFLYGTTMSGIDSWAAGQLGAALGGIASTSEKAQKIAQWTGAAVLGTGAAQSAMQEVYDQGGNDGTALLLGTLAGVNETFWEHFSIGNLIKESHEIGYKKFSEKMANVLKEAGVNFTEELNTSVANGLAEYIFNHDGREVQQKADEYERLGLSKDEAMAKARSEFWASAVMDGVGGALMGGAFGATENAQSTRYTKQVDKALGGSGFSKEALDSFYSAAEANPDSEAGKLANKYPKEKATAKQAGQVIRAVLTDDKTSGAMKDALRNTVKADFALRIAQAGIVDREAAEAVTAMIEGKALTDEQVAAIARNKAALGITQGLFMPEVKAEGTKEGAAPHQPPAAAASPQGEALKNALQPVEMEAAPGMEIAPHQSAQALTASPRGEAFAPHQSAQALTASPRGEALRIDVETAMKGDKSEGRKRITDIAEGKDGGVKVTLDGGATVDLEDTDLSPDMQQAARIAAGMDDKDAAAALMNAAKEALGAAPHQSGASADGTSSVSASADSFPSRGSLLDEDAAKVAKDAAGTSSAAGAAPSPQGEGLAGRDFALGFKKIYEAAKADKVDARTLYGEQLDAKTRRIAEDAGRKAAERLQAQAQERNMQEAKAFGFKTVAEAKGAAGVQFAGVGESLRDKKGNVIQAKMNAILLLDKFGKETGLQVRVTDRLENDANGKYVQGTNIVYVSLDAEGGAITKAASHEGFHFISRYSPDMKKTITDFVMDKLGKVEGYDIEQRIREVQEQYRTGAGQELTPEQAREEIVADAMLDVIGTEENLRDLMKQSKSAFEKVTAWISDTYNKFREILNRLAGNSPEVKALKDDVDYIGRIRDMYARAMEEAKKAYQQSQQGYSETAEALKNSQAVKQYRADMETAVTPEDRENSLTAFLSTLFGEQQKAWIQANTDKWEEGLAKFRQALLDYKKNGVALNVALARQGLDTVNGPDIRRASYAAEQVVEVEKERAENAQSNDGTPKHKYSLMTFSKQVDEMKKGNIPETDSLYVCSTPKVFQDIGFSVLPMTIDQYHANAAIKGTKPNHYIPENIFKTLPEQLGKPIAIIESTSRPDDSVVVIFDKTLKTGQWMAAIEIEGIRNLNGKEYKVIPINNSQGRKNSITKLLADALQSEIEKGHGVFYINEKRARELGEPAGVQFPSYLPQNGLVHKITDKLSFVKAKYSLPTRQAQKADAAESVKDDAELYARVKMDEDTRAALQLLTRLHEQTTGGGENALIKKGAYEKRLSEMVEKIKTDTATAMSDRAIRKGLRTIYQAMEKEGYNPGEILTYAKEFYRQILEKAPGVMAEQDETTKEALRILKENRFRLTEDQESEIRGTYGSLGDWMRKNFGKLKISNSAKVTLADVWRESLTPLNPGLFAEDTAEADMPIILDAWLETANGKKFAGEFGANIGAMATDGAMNLMLDFYDVPGALRSKGEIGADYQERFDNARALVNQYRREAREAVNTARAEYRQKYNERIEKYKETKEKQEMRDRIARSMRAINTMTLKPTDRRHVPMELKEMADQALDALMKGKGGFSKEKLLLLENEYRRLEEIKGELTGWDEETLGRIGWLAENLDKKSLKDLTLEELEELNKLAGNLHHMILEENKAFIDGREETIDHFSEQFGLEMEKKKEASKSKAASAIRGFRYKNTTPTYFADQAGGVLKGLVKQLFLGQRTAYHVAAKGRDLLSALVKKYKVNSWINDKTQKTIKTEQGHTIRIDRRMAMELAALWEREINSGDINTQELRVGGFTYKQKEAERLNMDTTTAHRLTSADMAQITAWLGDEQMKYMRAVVSMLSNEMAMEGNEVSMRLHGYEKFTEKNYYPRAVDRRFLSTELTNTEERIGQPKNKGFTKALARNTVTPIAVGDFMETVTQHINDMAIYCGFAEVADTANRLMNRRSVGANANTGELMEAESNWVKMEKAMGKEAVSYLRNLFKDVGGGINAGERTPIGKGLSAFKKASVAGNLSVWLQQPFAYFRAGAMVSPGYLTTALHPAKLRGYIERMYKYSEVANIKRIGKFDTGTGKSMAEWIGDSVKDPSKYKRVMNTLDEKVFGIGAEKADEWAFGFLWGAIENEVRHTQSLKAGSKEFYEAVKERFEDVVNHTQVYDSVLSKSEYMRSKNEAIMMATSFMAEPTLSANMLTDSIVRYNDKDMGAKQVARRAAAFMFAALFTAIGKALPGAWRRKDDEGRTFGEKWVAELVENFTYDISPAGLISMIPFARDAISLFEGYDVARSDMDAVEQFVKALQTLQNEKATLEDKLQNSIGAVANLFGLPVKNVWRDVEGIIRNLALGESAGESQSRGALKYTALESLNFEPFNFWDDNVKAYYDRMEQALIKGDKAQYEELREYLEGTRQIKPDSINSEVKNKIYSAVANGLMGETQAIALLGEHFDMDEDKAYYAIDKWRETQAHKGDEGWEYNKLNGVLDDVRAGVEIPKEDKQKLLDHGYSELDLMKGIEKEIGEWYKDGEITKAEAEKKLRQYAGMTDADEIYFDFDKWDYEKNQTKDDPTYSRYVDVDKAIREGKSAEAAIKELTDHGFEMDTIKKHMKTYIGQMYQGGDLTKAQATTKLKTYADIDDTYTVFWAFDEWDYKLKNAANRDAPSYTMWHYLKTAIDSGKDIQKTVKDIYLKNDTYKNKIADAITSNYKSEYVKLFNSGKMAEAADLKAKLLTAYEAAGYKRETKNKDIQKWIKDSKK